MEIRACVAGEKLYCTRYGMSDGDAYLYSVRENSGADAPYVMLVSGKSYLHVPKSQCFPDLYSAVANLKVQAARKIKSLQKQLKKVESLEFKEKLSARDDYRWRDRTGRFHAVPDMEYSYVYNVWVMLWNSLL